MNNFVSVFEELSKLYEADELEQDVAVEDADAEVVDEAPAAEGPKQLVLECSKCGAVCVKLEDDVVIDEATDLANVEEECAGCEEAAGYKVLGELLPYATDETEGEAEDEGEDFEESVDPDAAADESEPSPEATDEAADPGDPGSPADKEDISEELGVKLSDEEYDTLNGLVFHELGTIPEDGSKIEIDVPGLHISSKNIVNHQLESAIVTLVPIVEDVEEED